MAKEVKEVKNIEEVENKVENKEVETTDTSKRLTKKQAIAALKKEGAREFKGLIVKSVNVEKMSNYTRIGITLNEEIPAYRENENGEMVKTTSRFFFLSAYNLATELRENEVTAFVANRILEKVQNINFVLTGAKIDILQEEVEPLDGDGKPIVWHNLFGAEGDGVEFDHNVLINHLVGYTPSKMNLKMVDKIIDKMMDEDDEDNE